MKSLFSTERGFSLVEVAIAGALFLTVAGIITGVAAHLSGVRAEVAARDAIGAQLIASVDEVSAVNFDDLVSDTFTLPNPCPGVGAAGTRGSTCVTWAGQTYTITYTVTFGADPTGITSGGVHAADAVVTGTVTLGSGVELSRSRRVPAPRLAAAGEALLQVRLTGTYELIEGPLYLLDAADPTQIVASGTVGTGGVALLRAASAACTPASPCVLGLATGAARASDGVVALAPASLLGEGARISLTDGQITQIGAQVYVPGTATLGLVAEGDTGITAPARIPGSICLWASFNDGIDTRRIPFCNLSDPAAISLTTYHPDVTDPSLTTPLPTGTLITLTVDSPDGTCPEVAGQVGAVGATWQAAAVCTGWTWGVPSELRIGTDPPLAWVDAAFTLEPGVGLTADVAFAGALARPAAGYSGQPLWTNPREIPACAATASCASLGDTVPEDTACPGQQCLAARVPHLDAPIVGGQYAVAVGTDTFFDVTVSDDGGDPVTIIVDTLPATGTLTYAGNPVVAGNVVAVTDPGGGTISLEYTNASPGVLDTFDLHIANTLPNGAVVHPIALYTDPSTPWQITTGDGQGPQGGDGTVGIHAVGPDGTPAAGAVLTVTNTEPLLTVDASVTLDVNGDGVINVTADSTVTAGDYLFGIDAGNGRTADATYTVAQTAGTLTANSTATVAQGGSGTVTAGATDTAGNPMSGVIISFTGIDATSAPVAGIYTVPTGCVTDGTGTCVASLYVDAGVAADTYDLAAESGSFTVTNPLTVTQTVAKITATTGSLTQGGSVLVTAVVADGAGDPVGGAPVDVATPARLGASPATGSTAGDGSFTFAVTADANANAGVANITVTSGTVSFDTTITVVGVADSLSGGATVTVAQDSSATSSFTIVDVNAVPVAGGTVTFTSVPAGITVSDSTSGINGVAYFVATAGADTPTGDYTVTADIADLFNNPISTVDVTVTVIPGVVNVTAGGTVPSGSSGGWAITLIDGDGNGVAGKTFNIDHVPTGFTITGTYLTDGTGVAVVTVTDNGPSPAGSYEARITVTEGGHTHEFWRSFQVTG